MGGGFNMSCMCTLKVLPFSRIADLELE